MVFRLCISEWNQDKEKIAFFNFWFTEQPTVQHYANGFPCMPLFVYFYTLHLKFRNFFLTFFQYSIDVVISVRNTPLHLIHHCFSLFACSLSSAHHILVNFWYMYQITEVKMLIRIRIPGTHTEHNETTHKVHFCFDVESRCTQNTGHVQNLFRCLCRLIRPF